MSVMQWRRSAIIAWLALSCAVFLVAGSTTERSWWLLIASAAIPPAMLLWLWNEDRPLLLGSLRAGNRSSGLPRQR